MTVDVSRGRHSDGMTVYRLFFSDKDAHILGPAMTADVADDAAAMLKAEQIGYAPVFGATHVEIWDRGRFVARVPVKITRLPRPRRFAQDPEEQEG